MNITIPTYQELLLNSISDSPSVCHYEYLIRLLGISTFDGKKATVAFQSFLENHQRSDGFIAFDTSNRASENEICCPPIVGWIAVQMAKQAADYSFLSAVFPKIIKYHTYLYNHRDPSGDGLCTCKHPIETLEGVEYSINELSFEIIDPVFNAMLILSNEALIESMDSLEVKNDDLILLNELSIHTFNEKLWDSEYAIYNALNIANDITIPLEHLAGFMPLIGGVPVIDEALEMLDMLNSPYFGGGDATDSHLYATISKGTNTAKQIKYDNSDSRYDFLWLLYDGFLKYETEEFEESAHVLREQVILKLEQADFPSFLSFTSSTNNASNLTAIALYLLLISTRE